MPMEFGGGPGWPQPAQAPQQLPPSLLQMAQGQAPAMAGDQFGGGPGFAPGGGGGNQQHYGSWAKSRDDDAIVRALTTFSGGSGDQFGGGPGFAPGGGAQQISPEDKARYFDASGGYKLDDPRQVAAEGGISPDQLRQGFLPRYGYNGQGYDYPSDKGGFFSIEALSRLGGQSVPGNGGTRPKCAVDQQLAVARHGAGLDHAQRFPYQHPNGIDVRWRASWHRYGNGDHRRAWNGRAKRLGTRNRRRPWDAQSVGRCLLLAGRGNWRVRRPLARRYKCLRNAPMVARASRKLKRGMPFHPDEVRAKIRATELVNRLQSHIFDGLELSVSQVHADQRSLRKCIPDLTAPQ